MKAILWRLRYTFELMRLLELSFRMAWENSGAMLDMLDGDTTECPLDCASAEYEEWRNSR